MNGRSVVGHCDGVGRHNGVGTRDEVGRCRSVNRNAMRPHARPDLADAGICQLEQMTRAIHPLCIKYNVQESLGKFLAGLGGLNRQLFTKLSHIGENLVGSCDLLGCDGRQNQDSWRLFLC